jgi:hypothetical protein
MHSTTGTRLDQLSNLLGDAEAALSGLMALLSNMPDGPMDALEPVQLMALLTPLVERIHLAQGLLPLLAARDLQHTVAPVSVLRDIPPRTPRE